ncbi:ElyC/SanA/YdcF family protein [Demequina activiva]|uniref:DUF218 domain-containing protein n=1 Tax=Demequina activiva TaxID=1582364 RepID=A0A919Q3K6_9MICO|nr:ElyC/SanA/YdcF family protein [Demequina activiva]GIG53798.1 hypothetical protein Dac01nite_05500 [Demequina activiva]
MRRWLVGAGVAAVAIALAGIPVYVLPATDEPGLVDVIFVIGPPTDARMDVALGMAEQGHSDALMVSLDPAESDEYPQAARVCAGDWGDALPADATVLCMKPDPFTTRGEARDLDAAMAAQGWESAAVVTLTPHVSRARMIMERCDTGEVSMIDSGEALAPWYWVYHYAYQSAGYAKAFVLQGC